MADGLRSRDAAESARIENMPNALNGMKRGRTSMKRWTARNVPTGVGKSGAAGESPVALLLGYAAERESFPSIVGGPPAYGV